MIIFIIYANFVITFISIILCIYIVGLHTKKNNLYYVVEGYNVVPVFV